MRDYMIQTDILVHKNFYLDIRRCLLHPCYAKVMDEKILDDYDKYRTVPSCKLESLVEILQHHLATDGAPGMHPSRQRPAEAFSSSRESPWKASAPHAPSSQESVQGDSSQRAGSSPDKIIVYSFFTSSFKLIETVSHD